MDNVIKNRIEQINYGEVPQGYVKTQFGIFPNEWSVDKTFCDLFDFYGGLSKSREALGEIGHPYLHYGDLHRNPVTVVSQNTYLDMPKYACDISGNETFLMKDGDVAFLDASEDLEGTSRAVLIDNPNNKTFIAGLHIINGRSKNNSLQKLYKQYITTPQYIKKQFQRLAVGFKVYGLNRDTLSKIKIAFPHSLSEQLKIAEILMKWDEAIGLYNCQIEKIKQYKSILLKKIFPKGGKNVPEWRFKDFTEDWEQRKLGDVGKTYGGLSGKSKEDFGHGDAKFVPYINVFTNPIADTEMTGSIEVDKRQNQVKKGDVFFTTSSETPEEVGMSSVWLKSEDNIYLNSFCFGFRPSTSINSYYLAYMLRSNGVRQRIVFLAQGISRYNISKKKMMEIEVPLPHETEQTQIGELFKLLDNLITLHQRKVDTIKKQRKVLQHYLLNGIVRVKQSI